MSTLHRKNRLKSKYAIAKSAKKSKKLDVFGMVLKAHLNLDQQLGDAGKLSNNLQKVLKPFDDVYSLLEGLPRYAIRVLNQWLYKHDLFDSSILPMGLDETGFTLDMQKAIFHGPFNFHGRLALE